MVESSVQPTDSVSLNDKRVETSNFDRYKGRKGITDRFAIISSTLVRAYNYFYEGNGKKMTFRAPRDPKTLEFCRKHLGEPQQKFGLVGFHYMTDDRGDIDPQDHDRLRGKVKIWAISETRYEELSGTHKQWPLLDGGFDQPQYDLIIKCTEENFQRMTFTPAADAFWKKKRPWYDALKEKERKAQEKVAQALGRIMPDDEIMAMLGGSMPSPTGGTDNAGDIDLSDIVADQPASA